MITASAILAAKVLSVGKIICFGQVIPLRRVMRSEELQVKQKIDLCSPKGDIIFLKKMICLRHCYTEKNHNAAHATPLAALLEENIHSDIQTVSKRRKKILGYVQ